MQRDPRLHDLLASLRTLAITHRLGDPEEAARLVDDLAAERVGAVQIREKSLPDRTLFRCAESAVRAARGRIAVLINGRPDVAQAAGADGVHLPSRGLPVAAIRRHFPDLLVGVSCHDSDEVDLAARDGADYVTFGPIRPTPSKDGLGTPPGLDGLRRAVATKQRMRVLALGGLDADAVSDGVVEQVAAAGADGVAGIRVFQDHAARHEIVRRVEAAWP